MTNAPSPESEAELIRIEQLGIVDESIRLELVGVWVYHRIVCDSPTKNKHSQLKTCAY